MVSKITIVALVAVCSGTISAAPRKPVKDAEVVESLPRIFFSSAKKKVSSGDALSVDEATGAANEHIAAYRAESDPRELGQAQASLQKWWTAQDAPADTVITRATIKQSLHDFKGALNDLDSVLVRDGNNLKALVLRATILQVQGKYAEARSTAARLVARTPQPIAIATLATIAGHNGEAEKSYSLLQMTLAQAHDLSPDHRAWMETSLAEIAVRMDDTAAARRHFDSALAAAPKDAYTLAAYCEFLMDQNDPTKALALVKDFGRMDNLLLRRAIALRAIAPNSDSLRADIADLKARFAASKLRGDFMHQREEGRFLLSLADQPRAALTVALENWSVQREPADARLLMEAAIAAGDRQAATEVVRWMEKTRIEDKKLASLASRIR